VSHLVTSDEGTLHSSDTTCKESDARSLRGGGGELGNLKTLTYVFTTFTYR
jgi:hypothetical protein